MVRRLGEWGWQPCVTSTPGAGQLCKDEGVEDVMSVLDLPLLSCVILDKCLQFSAPICSSLNWE